MKKALVWISLSLFLLAGVLAALAYRYFESYGNSSMPGSGQTIAVDIPNGAGPIQTAEWLEKAAVIEDSTAFVRWLRYYKRAAGKLKAGELAFRDNQSPEEVLQVLLHGTPITHKITIPEGLRIDEIGQLFEDAQLALAAEFTTKAHEVGFVHSLGIDANSLEGYLFPETYQFRKHTPVETILKSMVELTRLQFTPEAEVRRKELGFSELQALTLASIIEKETGAPEERPLIGGVFHNRLKKNWLLQTDPTVIYAVLLARGSFNGNITRADLGIDHPYNTYRVRGLPPGPICNPGGAAIQAALFPQATDAMFFVSKNNGTHEFCATLKCHNQAVDRFQRGGKRSHG